MPLQACISLKRRTVFPSFLPCRLRLSLIVSLIVGLPVAVSLGLPFSVPHVWIYSVIHWLARFDTRAEKVADRRSCSHWKGQLPSLSFSQCSLFRRLMHRLFRRMQLSAGTTRSVFSFYRSQCFTWSSIPPSHSSEIFTRQVLVRKVW